MKTTVLITALVATAVSALATAGQPNNQSGPQSRGLALDQNELAAGFRALESACFGCHSPNAAMDNRIAPPMATIKKHYIKRSTTFENFRDQLVDFVNDPSEKNAQMPGAIDKFGLMPQLSFDTAVSEQIAYYIYHSPLEAPDWFEQNYKSEQKRNQRMVPLQLTTNADYLRHGKEIALSTKAVLGSNLKQAISSGGALSAIAFCNENAVPITDRMSSELDASITRVSDRPRNADNAANENELAYITAATSSLAVGEQPKPAMTEIDGRMVGYYPIVTNGMCLQCHGTPGKEISDEALTAISARYPHDQAIGYGLNEARGIFVITMQKD